MSSEFCSLKKTNCRLSYRQTGVFFLRAPSISANARRSLCRLQLFYSSLHKEHDADAAFDTAVKNTRLLTLEK
jgi:hypothetical protein